MNMQLDRNLYDRITDKNASEAAEIFLACVLADNEVLKDCGLDENDFAENVHRMAFRACQRHFNAGHVFNAVLIKADLPKVFTTDAKSPFYEVTPAEYMQKLMLLGINPTTKAQLETSIHIIKSVSLAKVWGQEAETALQISSEGHSLLTLMDEIESAEKRLNEAKERLSSLKSSASAGASYLTMFQASARRDGVVGVPIALPEIAKVLSEPVFEAGNLYGLLSSSGEGKSSLTMQIIYHALKQGHPVLFLSYDQSAAQCVRQMIAQVHGIDLHQQRAPSSMMSPLEQDTCVKFAMWIDKQPLEIIRCQREGVVQLVVYARRFIKRMANGKTPLIVVDHIGKVKPRDPKLSPDRISGEVTVELKALADELAASVLILNQRNGEGGRRQNPRPIAKDLYGGEGARSDYDAIMTLYRPEKYKKEAEKIAATKQDWEIIGKVFGSEIEGVAEVASIKVRFGDPSIVERLKFEGRYTRYVSERPAVSQERML